MPRPNPNDAQLQRFKDFAAELEAEDDEKALERA
jgi:hypothetical protein